MPPRWQGRRGSRRPGLPTPAWAGRWASPCGTRPRCAAVAWACRRSPRVQRERPSTPAARGPRTPTARATPGGRDGAGPTVMRCAPRCRRRRVLESHACGGRSRLSTEAKPTRDGGMRRIRRLPELLHVTEPLVLGRPPHEVLEALGELLRAIPG